MKKPTLQIGFRGTEEYREKIQRAAMDRKIKVQGLLEEAVELYLGSPNNSEVVRHSADVTITNSAQLKKRTALYSMLDEILASGIDVFVKGLTYNIEAWTVALRAMERNESSESNEDAWQRADTLIHEVESIVEDAEEIARRSREDRDRNRVKSRGADSSDGDGDGHESGRS